jgi:hypothetical protein
MDDDREYGMDGMIDDMMAGRSPQSLLAKLIEGEMAETALYAQIAQCVPCEELRKIIMHMAEHERCQKEMLNALCNCFGVMSGYPADIATAYAEGKKNEKEKK